MNKLGLSGVRQRRAGFTLIELMIAVAIIAILAAVAIPNYTQYVKKGRRVQAKSALLDYAARQERYFAVNNVYSTLFVPLGYSSETVYVNGTATTAYYQMSLYAKTAVSGSSTALTAFTVQAVPATVGGQNTDACGTYYLSSVGAQTNALVTANTTGCW